MSAAKNGANPGVSTGAARLSKDGGPAFPAKVSVDRDTGEPMPHQFGNDDFCVTGISKRDYFAAKAMAALIQSGAIIEEHTSDGILRRPARVAIPPIAYEYADAMIEAREEPK